MEITEKIFWERFWKDIRLPQVVDYSFKNDRIIVETIKKYIPVASKNKTVLEIGCAPGKWLVMFNKELGYKIAGFEYCEPAYNKTIENFKLNNIDREDVDIKLVDFLKADFKEKYDVVVSLGFIEHFTDVESIFYRHFQLLNDSGYLIIGMPNFNGINYLIQTTIDRYLDQKIIINHNLKAMNPALMDSFAFNQKLKKVFSGYVGGFETGLFDTNAIKSKIFKYLVTLYIRFLNIIFGRLNLKFSSGYILSIYSK
jgi:2-polyprenyl-3-methyl-5-hydroxy-6-metoxy-1,4-benzoquinol methylase